MKKYKTIRIDSNYDKVVKTLIINSSFKSEKEYIEAMLNYFEKHGIEPVMSAPAINEELLKLRNLTVSFIREMEKRKLDPIINQLDEIKGFIVNNLVTKQDLADFLEIAFAGKANTDQVEITKQTVKQIFNKLISGLKESDSGLIINRNLFLEVKNQINNL